MSAEADLERIVADRAAGVLGERGCRSALAAAGFDQTDAAARDLDGLLRDPPGDLSIPAILTGCAASADPARALNNTMRLLLAPGRPPCPVQAGPLTAFLGATQHMADVLVSRPELLAQLGQPFETASAPARYVDAGAGSDREAALRRVQQADLLAIGWHDLVEGLDIEQVVLHLSRLADAVIAGAAAGLGTERHFAIIALGKLGGSELNYSSDVDLLFVRPDDVTDQVTADRVARDLLHLVSRATPDGHLYRTDVRLRPEGTIGLLTRTLSSCMEYYRQRGRPWERQMLTKARVLVEAGETGAAFLAGARRWILDCGLDAGAIRQFKRLKAATEARYRTSDNRTDIKQSPGGIRDIETVVQFLALQHATHHPALVVAPTLQGLERLRVAGAVSSLEAAHLRSAYRFHRCVENRLQLMHRIQTHRLPALRLPLARLMGHASVESFDAELDRHRGRVRRVFDRHFADAFARIEGPAAEVADLMLGSDPEPGRAHEVLADLGFRRTGDSLQVLRRAAAPLSRFLPASPRLVSSFASVAPALCERLSLASDPDTALDRFERMTRGVGAREVLYSQLAGRSHLMDMLCDLAGGSPYLADILVNEPSLLDGFIDALLTGAQGRQERRLDLAGHVQPDVDDPWLALSDYKKLELLRVGVRDLQDQATTQETLADLSKLCLDILRTAYRIVLAQVTRQHGTPMTIRGVSRRDSAGMTLVAFGKLGGLEANYAVDADLVFVFDNEGQTDQGLSNGVFFTRVAEEFIARLTGSRGGPRLYRVDTRLRPEGTKGPLVSVLRAWEHYYQSGRAAVFEHQALLKARVVAGNAELGQRIQRLIRDTLRRYDVPADLGDRMREMRARIEAGAHGRDLKRGAGGMVDIEFLTQYLQLRHARRHPKVLAQETPRALEALSDVGALPVHVAQRLRDIYLFFRRVETRLQIAFGLDTKEVPEEATAVRALALRLGYADTAEGDAGSLLLGDLLEATTEARARFEEVVV